jgi:hypothetical protein
LYTYPTAQLLRDPKHLRQPEAGSLADLLRREEWLEHLVKNVVRDPRTGVGDGTHHVITRYRLLGTLRRAKPNVRGFDRDRPTVRHRITGINCQVQDDQFDLARIGERQRETIGEDSLDPVCRAHRTLEQSSHTGDDPIEFDRFWGHALLPSEGKELRCESCAALSRCTYSGEQPDRGFIAAIDERFSSFLRDRAGLRVCTKSVPFPGVTDTQPGGINARGQIVGNYHDATGIHGFIVSGSSFP